MTVRLRSPGRPPLAPLMLIAALLAACPAAGPDPDPDPPPRAPGTERMALRLERFIENLRPMQYTFMDRERLDFLRQLPLPTDLKGRVGAGIRLANELLRAGESEDAAAELGQLIELVQREPGEFPPDLLPSLRSLRAVSFLRIAEQENCLLNHSAESCLFPIRGDGVHRLQQGSRAALEELTVLLRDDPADLVSRWLYNLTSMTLGEYPQNVPEDWLIPPEVFASAAEVGRFPDVAPALGLDTIDNAGGVVLEDLDGDGYLDVLVSSWGIRDPLRFFRNRGDGGFEERSREAGLTGLVGGLNLIPADYDNDGDVDVLVLRGAWLAQAGRQPNSLLRNDGRGFFEDVTEEAGILSFHPTQTAAWGDYDNDGWLDLYIGNESFRGSSHPCELYRNNRDGTFTDVARETGTEAGGYVKGVVWGDYDNDGWLDLYLSRMQSRNLLLHNEAGPNGRIFREVAREAGVTGSNSSFPTWFWDYDNDGHLDLFAAGFASDFLEAHSTGVIADYLGLPVEGGKPRLYRNNGDGTFSDRTSEAGLDHCLLAMGANFGDVDNDGWPDLYVGTGAPDFRALVPNRMFRNAEGRFFQDVTTSAGVGHLQKGHGIAFADLDNDGDQDVFAVLGGAFSGDVYQNALFLNPGHGNHWITLRLEGVETNRSAIGARIRLELQTPRGSRQVHATVGSGGSFGASSLQAEIGLGDATALRIAEIRWPGGRPQIFRDLPLDRILRLREGDPEPVAVELRALELSSGSRAVHSAKHH